MTVAYVFPGQGSQTVGMLKDVYAASERAREMLDAADRALGFSLSRLMLDGPEEVLRATENAQPALFVAGAVLWTLYREALAARGIEEAPMFVAGHSLGQYAALYAAGALAYEEGVRLVRRRGELMAASGGTGGMAAVLGADAALIEAVLAEFPPALQAAGERVELANDNAPGQLVLSGTEAGLRWAEAALRERGVRRFVRLKVSGPFHSSLMAEAAAAYRSVLATVAFRAPAVPVVDNVTADVLDAAAIAERLAEQIMRPVRWTDSVRFMVARGVRRFVEFGPGGVLAGLIRRIAPEVRVDSAGDLKGLERLLAERAPERG
ncbi:MAG: Malonyl CoA-acyl carrier protein transacylase [Hydrogenibacillus schlegelii]|uniref:Malonyl CoA-acyl carrier protein transacylase n=1 Tax=Hydrogenibacillus schlegelii TaxID=1484 RepID=A0A2T5GFE4_HYDSH|nr:ACP S-malonyltransferase [Hydrogenibacillus schlegelii]PTQ54897.1 MAG: Malonyl CoA-acyl carrier protein transacylase [Hydrogenibacillus schlegelii]